MGVTEQIIFPEIDYDQIDKIRGLDVTVTTTAKPTMKAWHYCGLSTSPSGTKRS